MLLRIKDGDLFGKNEPRRIQTIIYYGSISKFKTHQSKTDLY